LADLLPDRLDHPGRAVPQEVAAPAREEVEVAVALGVPDPRPLTPDEANRVASVVGDDVTAELGHHFRGTRAGDLGQRLGLHEGQRCAGLDSASCVECVKRTNFYF